ncbi:MAG: WG repeat-containing protein [Tidjanibacter sp.]|nr:WG repeat-containing protein [Tidjanibacter sp.]
MTHFTIDAYFEALHSHHQRHPRLTDMHPLSHLSHNGYRLAQNTITFSLSDGKKLWNLTLPTKEGFELTRKEIEVRISQVARHPLFVEAHYFPNALTLFDESGKCLVCQGILQEAYTPLTDFIRLNCSSKRRSNLRTALQNVAMACRTLLRDGIHHGSLDYHSLTFDESGTLYIADYPLSTQKTSDYIHLAEAAILLFVAGCDIEAYKILIQRKPSPEDYQRRLRHILSAAEHYDISPLIRLAKLLATPANGNTFAEAIEQLSCEGFRAMPLLHSLLATHHQAGTITVSPYDHDEYIEGEMVDFAKCDEVYQSDQIVRFRKGDIWGYAHWNGEYIAIERIILYANDFAEGRAVIRTKRGYGMIDTSGRVVMNDVWEDLCWYGDENIATASDENGKWYIFDRLGRRLSTIPAEWLGDPSEGFVVARKGKKFGYYATNGDRLTDFIYDEAFSFCNGVALVTKGKSRYHIDTTLHRISNNQEEIVRKLRIENYFP